jgi:hypothetical protein
MTKIRSSPNKYSFQRKSYIERCKERDQEPNQEYLDFWERMIEERRMNERNILWQENNMEYDLLTSDWIAEKCKDDRYAQNLYAALCNNEFIKNDVWPILTEKTWSCSWRYAGGIIADIREQGDYIDWYCSGMGSGLGNGDEDGSKGYVGESEVTDEIKDDLFKLGWIVFESSKDN